MTPEDMGSAPNEDVLAELAALPTMAKPVVSPDGRRVALYDDRSGRNEVHVLDLESGRYDRWTNGEPPANAVTSHLVWAPDGDRVLFHRDEAGDEQFDVCAVAADGTVDPLIETTGKSLVLDVAGSAVVFRSTHGGGMDLYRYDVTTGETDRLTDRDDPVWRAAAAPDGRVAYQAAAADSDTRIRVVDPDGGDEVIDFGAAGGDARPVGWTTDGSSLLVGDNADGYWQPRVYDVEAGTVERFGDGRYDEKPVAFLPGDDRFVVKRDRAATTLPAVYGFDSGSARELDLPDGVVPFGLLYSRSRLTAADGRLVVLHTAATRQPALLAYDLASDDYDELLAPQHGPFDESDFASPTYFRFRSDGVPETPARAVDHDPYEDLEIGALLYDPDNRPAPLVVNPHGGPRLHDTRSFDVFAQALAARGYAVLQVNFRGSTGRGRRFAARLEGDWGGGEAGDIATGVEHALATHDWLDSDRVAVFGGSFGGYETYWQLVQYPDLYDAGVASVGYTDLAAAHEEVSPQFRSFLETYLGTPDQNPRLYEQRSPVTHVDNLEAPLLILHGANDPRVPVSQARRFRDALAGAGYREGPDGDFEYVEFDDEGHGSTATDAERRTFRLLDDFLGRRLDPAA